jgi:hypothetical protein
MARRMLGGSARSRGYQRSLIAAIMSFCRRDYDGVRQVHFGHPGRGRSLTSMQKETLCNTMN